MTGDILARYLGGELSAPTALVHLLMRHRDPEAVRATLRDGGPGADGRSPQDILALLDSHEGGIDTILGILAGEPVDDELPGDSVAERLAACRAMFDRSVGFNPEVSVAFYSLGSPEILAKATAEIVDLLRRWELLGKERRLLEIGCGIGRIVAALAPEVGSIAGIDIAGAMIVEAQRRCADLDNVTLLQSSGRDLALFDDGSFDAVLAVDSFPYVYQQGEDLVEVHFAEAARVLRPGGEFVILNMSYRGDLPADRADALRLARAHGFELLRDGTAEFALWDGRAFRLRRLA